MAYVLGKFVCFFGNVITLLMDVLFLVSWGVGVVGVSKWGTACFERPCVKE